MSAVVGMSSLILIASSSRVVINSTNGLRCTGPLVVPNYGAVGDLGSSPTKPHRSGLVLGPCCLVSHNG